jgi:uncharacterized membrane protein
MSYQGQDPNQPGQYPGQPGQPSQPSQPGQYGGYTPPQPQPTDPYSGQQPGYQQPGYQQPPYGQPQGGYQQQAGYQQPYGAPQSAYSNLGPTSMNMDANVAAGLSYILSWVTGLIFFLIEKQNRFVRFHAMQSIILGGGVAVIEIALSFLGYFVPLMGCLSSLVGIAFFIVSIICIVNAFQGKYFKLPVIGDYAERYANPAPPSPIL